MGVTHLTTHTGKTKKWRIQATAPTSPTLVTGDVYVDNSAGAEAMGIYKVNGWVFLSLKK